MKSTIATMLIFALLDAATSRIYIGSGREANDGEGPGRLVCIDPTKNGDISSELAVDREGNRLPHRRQQAVDPAKGERAIANPDSGLVWEFTQSGEDIIENTMHRTLSTVVTTAAIKHGARAIGYEIDKELVAVSRARARTAAVADLVEVKFQDMYASKQ